MDAVSVIVGAIGMLLVLALVGLVLRAGKPVPEAVGLPGGAGAAEPVFVPPTPRTEAQVALVATLIAAEDLLPDEARRRLDEVYEQIPPLSPADLWAVSMQGTARAMRDQRRIYGGDDEAQRRLAVESISAAELNLDMASDAAAPMTSA